jgi:hypothetical protein
MPDTTTGRQWPGPATAPYLNGNLMEWVSGHVYRKQLTCADYMTPDEWRPNNPFTATLILTGTDRRRSSALLTWAGTGELTGRTYPMFLTDAHDIMMSPQGIRNGTAVGTWIIVKRGSNFGVARLNAPDPTPDHTPDTTRALIAALRERADPDGIVTTAALHRSSLIGASRQWIQARLSTATDGIAPLPGVAITSTRPGEWRATFARRCDTCNLWIPDGMPHPHTLQPATWEKP